MNIEDFKTLHLVTLSGGGDTYHKLVGPKTFDWFFTEYDSTASSYNEKIPGDVAEEFSAFDANWKQYNKNATIHVSVGSSDNDRAIQSVGKDFNSASEACKWAIKNGIELGEEYDGCSY